MATNIDALNATTLKEIWPRVVRDVFFKNSPKLAYFRRNVVPFEGGVSMDQTFMYSALIGGSYAKGQSFNLAKPETIAGLTFQPKTYFTNVSEFLEDVEIFNKGPLAVFSRVDLDLKNAMNTINAIIAIALNRHGQAIAGDDRSLEINGLAEAMNNGVDPSWEGHVFTTYGGETRNGTVGSTLNSIPRWVGDAAGNPGTISYPILEESYQDATRGPLEPNLISTNKAGIAYIKERLEAKQIVQQERDPYYGASGFKFNSAMVLKDDYDPSFRYGVNDPLLGNYLTAAFTTPVTVTTQSGLPSNTSVTPGEVIFMYNTDSWQFRLSNSPLYGFGFTGFKYRDDNTRVAGQVLAAVNAICLDPQLNKQLYGING
jgi:hypothetical protein